MAGHLQNRFGRFGLVLATMVIASAAAQEASAVPILQLYLEGSTYDDSTESWTLTPEGSSSGGTFRLWAIGNVAGPGGAGTISDVRLAVVYSNDFSGLEVSLTPTTVGGDGEYDGIVDPSAPASGTLSTGGTGHIQTVTDGSVPKLGDGKSLPSHGEYGVGMTWQEFYLGHFTQTDATIADFIDAFPSMSNMTHDAGQINVYEVSVTLANGESPHGAIVHFDLYDHVQAKKKGRSVFAPFSHDADGTANIVPTPAAAAMGMVMWIGLAAVRPMRRRQA